MSKVKRPAIGGIIVVSAIVAIVLATGGLTTADSPVGLRAYSGGPAADPLTQNLPPVTRGPMTVTRAGEATSVLSFDDGSCEAGLGAGITVTDFVDFDVPTQCIQSGLEIVGLTTRMNTGSGQAFAFAQAGATPPAAGAASTIALSAAIPAFGACPATTLTGRAIAPGAAVITGTANFFAGFVNTGFAGRDTTGTAAGRIWLLCAGCGMTQYTPTDLSGLGLGGNWMIRVTVEDANCVPVELMEFTIS